MINKEQFDNIPKDYYVAVKLDAVDTDAKQKLVDLNSIKTAKIIGYTDYLFMKNKVGVVNFGEGEAKWIYYDRLLGIDKLLNMF